MRTAIALLLCLFSGGAWAAPVCDGVTDDTAALIASDAVASAAQAPLYLPPGNCVYSAIITPTTSWRGAPTTLWSATPTAGLAVSNPGLGFEDLTFNVMVPRGTGATDMAITATSATVRRVVFLQPFYAITTSAIVLVLEDVSWGFVTPGSGVGIVVNNCVDCQWSRVNGGGPTDQALWPFAHVLLNNVGDIHCYDCNFFQAHNDLYIDPGNGQAVSSFKMLGGYLDSANYGLVIAPTGNGNVNKISFTDTWVAVNNDGSSGWLLYPSGTAVINDVECIACEFLSAAPNTAGVNIVQPAGTSVTNVRLSEGCIAVKGVGFQAAGGGAFALNDVVLGNCGSLGPVAIGVKLSGAILAFSMHDVNYGGATVKIINTATITRSNIHHNY